VFSHQNSSKLKECLACGSSHLRLTLDLGEQPLANSYKDSPDQIQESFPLAINRCEKCYHVQLTHAVNPELMFKEYLYVSGTSNTMRQHFDWFANFTKEYFNFANAARPMNVLDIGCNDGTQLDYYKEKGLNTYGIDPAENLYERSSKNHIVYKSFFGMDFVVNHPETYDIITAQNVFAHNYDPAKFLCAVRNIMNSDTLLFVQTSQSDMILNNEFDTIYHEHINFFNINSMNELCKRKELYLIDVVKCPLHGNSYIFVISKNKSIRRQSHIQNLIDMERKAGLMSEQTYIDYAKKCEEVVSELRNVSNDYNRFDVGFSVIGYGAAAKGMTLLNYSKIKLDYIIDDNPLKQGKYTPGSNIPIVSSDVLKDIKNGILFIPLAWNFYDEIRSRIKSVRDNKYDLFCKYFPKVEIKT
jgi:2-polyprenyl-3-methyl-5-hydroxy-6-metoxy-1,4-benzoquinol methylase